MYSVQALLPKVDLWSRGSSHCSCQESTLGAATPGSQDSELENRKGQKPRKKSRDTARLQDRAGLRWALEDVMEKREQSLERR